MAISPEALQSHPLGHELTGPQLGALASLAVEARFEPGQLIFRQGQAADALYLVVEGRAALEQHVPGRGSLQLEGLRAGDVLGLSWMYPGATWTLDARAVEPVRALRLEASGLREKMAADPLLGFAVTNWLNARLYERLQRVRLQRLDVYRAEA